MPEQWTQADLKQGDVVFLRRKSDGRFYRGARLWRWCRSWRNATIFDVCFWRTMLFIGHIKGDATEFEFVTLNDVREMERGDD